MEMRRKGRKGKEDKREEKGKGKERERKIKGKGKGEKEDGREGRGKGKQGKERKRKQGKERKILPGDIYVLQNSTTRWEQRFRFCVMFDCPSYWLSCFTHPRFDNFSSWVEKKNPCICSVTVSDVSLIDGCCSSSWLL